MLISLIIPVYNKAEYLAPLLQSVVNQTYQNLEIICVDDGSTDGSPAILEEFRKKDPRIRVVRQENQGVSEARNTGLRIATGEAVAFADCDDLLPDYAIGHLASLFSPDVDAVVSSVDTKYEVHSEYASSDDSYFRVKEDGIRSITSHDLFGLHCLAVAKLFRRSLIQELELEFPRGIYYEDAFWHWCFMMNVRRVCFTPKPCYTYIRHPNSIMSLTYEKREGLAIHHLFVVEAILAFLKKGCRNKLDPKDTDDLLRDYFWLAFNNSPAFEQPRTVWECSRFLRSENYDCSRTPFLQEMKDGNFYPDAEKRIGEAEREKALLQEKTEALRSERESLRQELGRAKEDAARFSKEAFDWKKKCLRPKYYRYVLLSKATIGRRRAHYRTKAQALRKEFGFR